MPLSVADVQFCLCVVDLFSTALDCVTPGLCANMFFPCISSCVFVCIGVCVCVCVVCVCVRA